MIKKVSHALLLPTSNAGAWSIAYSLFLKIFNLLEFCFTNSSSHFCFIDGYYSRCCDIFVLFFNSNWRHSVTIGKIILRTTATSICFHVFTMTHKWILDYYWSVCHWYIIMCTSQIWFFWGKIWPDIRRFRWWFRLIIS